MIAIVSLFRDLVDAGFSFARIVGESCYGRIVRTPLITTRAFVQRFPACFSQPKRIESKILSLRMILL